MVFYKILVNIVLKVDLKLRLLWIFKNIIFFYRVKRIVRGKILVFFSK